MFKIFDIDTCVAFITNQAAKKISHSFNERLMKSGISRVQWTALYYLSKEEKITQSELADKMDIKNSTVARLIDRMERDGFLSRERSQKDRRVTNVYLTDKGIKIWKKLMPEGIRVSEIVAENISLEEMEIFKGVLKKMGENAKDI